MQQNKINIKRMIKILICGPNRNFRLQLYIYLYGAIIVNMQTKGLKVATIAWDTGGKISSTYQGPQNTKGNNWNAANVIHDHKE